MNIGFVDYDLNNFHADTYLRLVREELAARGAEVVACYGLCEDSSRAWAEQHRVPWAPSPEAVAERADALFLLAPDNAEQHLPLATRLFPAQKPTYVDKTFADTLAHAEAICELAARYGTPFFSTSALRYAVEVEAFFAAHPDIRPLDVATYGPAEWSRYGVHAVEPLVARMGTAIRRFRAVGRPELVRLVVEWEDGRTGLATVNGLGRGQQGFAMHLTWAEGVAEIAIRDLAFYRRLAEEALAFFATGVPPVPAAETLTVMTLLDRGWASLHEDRWVEV